MADWAALYAFKERVEKQQFSALEDRGQLIPDLSQWLEALAT